MAKKTAATPPAEEREEDTGADLFDEEFENAKSLNDVAGPDGGQYEGELVTLEAIAGKKVLVKDYRLMPSTFKEGGTYACISIKLQGGRMVVINTNAMVPVKTLAAIEDKSELPFVTTFYMRAPKATGGKEYWDMKG